MEDNETMIVKEPAMAALSESASKSGLLGLVKGLSHPDKVALIAYQKKEVGQEEAFKTDELGRVVLTREMREAVHQAEKILKGGKCVNEDVFQKRFAKWQIKKDTLTNVLVHREVGQN